jgi:hypothetical protein
MKELVEPGLHVLDVLGVLGKLLRGPEHGGAQEFPGLVVVASGEAQALLVERALI